MIIYPAGDSRSALQGDQRVAASARYRSDSGLFLQPVRSYHAGVAWFHYTLPGRKVKQFIALY